LKVQKAAVRAVLIVTQITEHGQPIAV